MGSSVGAQDPAATAGISLLSQTFGLEALFPCINYVSCLTPGLVEWIHSGAVWSVVALVYSDSDPLVHLCGVREWEDYRTAGEVRPASLDDVGFVHLSTRRQVHLPADRLFAGRSDLVLLYVDRRVLDAPLRWEPGVPGDPAAMLFPHLYGPLPLDAVVDVRPYSPGVDGRFPPLTDDPAQ